MRAYLTFDDGSIEEFGEVRRDEVAALIGQAERSLQTERHCGIGLCRSDDDFLEIRPVGNDEFMIWSDVIAHAPSGGWISRLFSRHSTHIEKQVAGPQSALKIALDYMDQKRDAFESKYVRS